MSAALSQRGGFSKPSSVSTLNNISNNAVDERTKCRIHPKKQLFLFCALCEKPVCDKCKETTHARHASDVKSRNAMVSASRSRRRYLIKVLDTKQKHVIPSIENTMIQILESKSKLESEIQSAIEKYQSYATVHLDKLAISEEEWVDDVIYRASRFYQTMDEKLDFLYKKRTDVVSTLSFIKEQLEESNNPELLLIFRNLRSSLENIHAPIWPLEEISVRLSLKTVPEFGAVPIENDFLDRNCTIEFCDQLVEPTVYTRIFDTKIPVPKKVLLDEHAKISLASSDEMFISFGEYIVVYQLDNRRFAKSSANVKYNRIITVRQNVIDIACDTNGDLYFVVNNAVKKVPPNGKRTVKCFSLKSTPSAMCISFLDSGMTGVLIGFHDTGQLIKYSKTGDIVMVLTHPDTRMIYRPRHLTTNYIGDIFFSDDISNITILDANGIWKGSIARDATASPACRLLRPSGIACAPQRHVFIIDANAMANIHIYTEDGKFLQTAMFKNLNEAYVLNIDKTEDIWVAFKDGRVRIYRPNPIASVLS